jgi:hypothetical protein
MLLIYQGTAPTPRSPDDLDAAIELASQVPAARMGGAVEVRPLMNQS